MFTLLELLRRRRQLEAPEVLRLVGGLPKLLLAAKPMGDDPLLGIVRVQFVASEDAAEAHTFFETRVEQWPPFILCLDEIAPTADGVSQRAGAKLSGRAITLLFARLLYELLGGPNREPGETYFPPLPELTEEGNAILNAALTKKSPPDIARFWRDFSSACGGAAAPDLGDARDARQLTFRISEKRATFEIGSVLTLTPDDPAIAPWRFISRALFRFGRSAEEADFVASFQPETPANVTRTKSISRVHAIAEVQNEQLTLRDGNGSKASVNGSKLDGIPLSAKNPTVLEKPGVLSLGREYFLRLVPVGSPGAWEIVNPVGWLNFDQLAPPVLGAVLIAPVGAQPACIPIVWLLNRIGFHLDGAGQIIMDDEVNSVSSAMFFFQSSCFLLANLSLTAAQLSIDGWPIAKWEAVPLRTGQALRIGRRTFAVRVE